MKKILIVFTLMMVLLGTSGCSTMKTYKDEDTKVYKVITELSELKEEFDGTEITFDYELKRGLDGKYVIVMTFEFGDHNSEWKSIPFTIEEIENLDLSSEVNMDEFFTFKIDGTKYKWSAAQALLTVYFEEFEDGM